MPLTHSRTYATLEVPRDFYAFVVAALRDAGYDHAFVSGAPDAPIDISGLALVPCEKIAAPVSPGSTTGRGDSGKFEVASDVYWRYDKAPLGTKIFLLTEGGVAVVGQWADNAGFKGWHPLFRRDKATEERLGL